MRLPTVKIRKKSNHRICRIINESEWAADLGVGIYRGWERYGEMHTGQKEDVVDYGVIDKLETAKKEATTSVTLVDDIEPKTEEEILEGNNTIEVTDEVVETFTDRGGNSQPVKRGRGRPRKQ